MRGGFLIQLAFCKQKKISAPLLRKILGLLLFKNILGLNHRKRSDKNEKFSPRRDTFFRLQLYKKVRFFYELK